MTDELDGQDIVPTLDVVCTCPDPECAMHGEGGWAKTLTDAGGRELKSVEIAPGVLWSDHGMVTIEPETPTLSTGQPSTLGVWRDLSAALWGEGPQTAFLDAKIAVEGRDEPVLADEGQMLGLLASL